MFTPRHLDLEYRPWCLAIPVRTPPGFKISLSLLFYPLANSLFFSFSFITSASVAPKYLNSFHLFLPLSRRLLRVFIEGMPLALPFNVDILSRNGRISEVCHLPDDITIKALNGSLTTYKLFGVTYGNGNHFKSGMCLPSPRVLQAGCHTSMMACWNIIKEDQDFGTVESQKSPLLPLAISYRMPFINNYLRQ